MNVMKCACCGVGSVDGEYDICPVCGWEKDNVQERFIGFRGGANRPCLAEAREAYRMNKGVHTSNEKEQ
ncbi:MAG: hypothetical protein IJT87_12150 [Ruminiclostridium sp.]|nr:hypothetical protein [Ruminiclostridium sp.]